MLRIRLMGLALAICGIALLPVQARRPEFTYYTVQFDCWKNGMNCKSVAGKGTSFDYHALDLKTANLVGWTSVGYDDGGDPPKPIGSRILNDSGKTVVSFRIMIDKSIGKDARFKVDAASGGELFKHGEVWRRNDDTEVVFRGTSIPDSTRFWNLVYPAAPTYPDPYFLGTALTYYYQIPDPENWQRVYPTTEVARSRLVRNLLAACPYYLRDFAALAESPDGKTAVFVSDDDLFVYDDAAREIHRLSEPREVQFGIDRITSEQRTGHGEFVLWRKDREVGRVRLDGLKKGRLIGRVPGTAPTKP
jgi:hypothetical protein